MSNLRWLIRRINHFLHVPARTVTANHAHKLFHVMAAQLQLWLPFLRELRRTKFICRLADVIKLVLYQSAEFQIGTL